MSLCIDRCLCHDRRFSELAVVARAAGATTVPDLQAAAYAAEADFGRGCGLCHPYVRRMLRTGETVFETIVTDSDEPDPGSARG